MLRIAADHTHHALAVDDLAFVTHYFDRRSDFHGLKILPKFVYGLVKTQGPFAVIATVCSKCAEYFPSSVTAVQRSALTRLPAFPAFTIGSIASTIPSFNRGFSLRRST